MSFDEKIQELWNNKDKNKEKAYFKVGQKVRLKKIYEERSGDSYWSKELREVVGIFHTLGGRCIIKVKDDEGNTAGVYQEYLDFRFRK